MSYNCKLYNHYAYSFQRNGEIFREKLAFFCDNLFPEEKTKMRKF